MSYHDFKQMVERKRQERNREIAEACRKGEYLPAAFDQTASWFPERPLIKKDKDAVKRLYGIKDEETK